MKKLRAFVTYYLDDKSPPRIVYEVWVYDVTDPDHPRKLPDRLGTYASLRYAERARGSFDVHRVAIELEQDPATRERRTAEQGA